MFAIEEFRGLRSIAAVLCSCFGYTQVIMLLSHSRRFVFVHVYKTGGTSIRHALAPLAANRLGRIAYERLGRPRLLRRFDIMPVSVHSTAAAIRKAIGEKIYDSYFSFAVVRNPWDWQVSLYNFMLKRTDHFRHEEIKALKTFDNYVRWICDGRAEMQSRYVCDEHGRVMVSYLGKMESLSADFDYICRRLNLRLALPHENQSNSVPYQTFYSDATRDMISSTFATDIDKFKYSFGD